MGGCGGGSGTANGAAGAKPGRGGCIPDGSSPSCSRSGSAHRPRPAGGSARSGGDCGGLCPLSGPARPLACSGAWQKVSRGGDHPEAPADTCPLPALGFLARREESEAGGWCRGDRLESRRAAQSRHLRRPLQPRAAPEPPGAGEGTWATSAVLVVCPRGCACPSAARAVLGRGQSPRGLGAFP